MPLSDPPGGKPVCRDAYLRQMARYLADFFTTGRARNLFIYGPPGTGKTICAKHVLAEAAKHAQEKNIEAKTVYVNAGKTRNPYYTMTEIITQLGINVPQAGWQMFRLKQTFEHVLTENAVLIAIDEVDSIILKEKEPLVYCLSRQPKTTLILIATTQTTSQNSQKEPSAHCNQSSYMLSLTQPQKSNTYSNNAQNTPSSPTR
jgi:cell division control protein 6